MIWEWSEWEDVAVKTAGDRWGDENVVGAVATVLRGAENSKAEFIVIQDV